MYDASYNEDYLSILIYLQDAVSFSSGGGTCHAAPTTVHLCGQHEMLDYQVQCVDYAVLKTIQPLSGV